MTAQEKARWMAVALTVLTLVAAGAIVLRSALDEPDASTASATPEAGAGTMPASDPSEDVDGVAIYRGWQQRRQQAWREGSVRALTSLYVGPEAARSDVRRLRQWLRRGASGVDLTHQLLVCDVVRHRPDEVRVRVTQRLARAVVLSDAPEVELPRGRAQRNEVALRRVDGIWRVTEVVRLGDG